MRKIISDQQKEDFSKKYYQRIVKAVRQGLQDLHDILNLKTVDYQGATFDRVTMATILNNCVRNRMKLEFGEDQNIDFDSVNRLFCMKVDKSIAVRFNKMSKGLETSPPKTSQSHKYKNQLPIKGLDDAYTLLYAGYVLDSTWADIKNIYLVCRRGDDVLWHRDIATETEQLWIVFGEKQEEENKQERRKPRFKPNKDGNDETKTGTD